MGTNKKAGWLIDYDGTEFIPITCVDEIYNHGGSKIFGRVLEDGRNYSLGSGSKPIYIKNGVFEESANNIAHSKRLMYMENGELKASGANEGSNVNPVYLYEGQIIQSDATIGSATKPIWLNGGTITVSNGNVATDEKTLMYMSGGELLASDATEGANDKFIYLNSGTLTASTLNKGGADIPVYFVNGVVTEGSSSSYSLSRSTESDSITIALARGTSPAYSTISYNLGDNLVGNATTNTISAGYQTAEFSTGLQISEGSVSEDDLYVPVATSSEYGVVKIGYTTSGRNFAVQLSGGKMYVNVPSDNTTYSAGTGLDLDGTTFNITKESSYEIFSQLTSVTGDATSTTYLISQDTGGVNNFYRRPAGKVVNATLVKAALGTGSGTTKYLREDGTWATPPDTNTDTKNTAGSTNSTSKLFLIGATTQDANPQTYSNSGVYATNGALTAASFNANSDIRLKENFRPFIHNNILDLPIYKFDYINGVKDRIGCIAQDLQKICPEIVHKDEDGYLSIEESKIVYLLLDKMKEMQKEIDELKEG